MLESHAVFFIQAYAASFLLGQTSPLLHGAAFFTLLCFFAHPRSKFSNQTLWSTKDFVKLLFSGHHAHSMVMHVNIMAWHYIGTVTLMLATGLPFDTIWRVDLALDALVLCAKQPPRGFGQFALQHAPPAPDQTQGGLQPQPTGPSSGWPVICFWLAGHTGLVFHLGARLHQALRSAAVHLLRVPPLHRAELRRLRTPPRLCHLRLDARPHLALLRPPGQHVEVPGKCMGRRWAWAALRARSKEHRHRPDPDCSRRCCRLAVPVPPIRPFLRAGSVYNAALCSLYIQPWHPA